MLKYQKELCSGQNCQKMKLLSWQEENCQKMNSCLGKKRVPRIWMCHSRSSLLGMLLKLLMGPWLERSLC